MARVQPEKTLRAESSILSLKVLDIGLLAIIDADYTLRFLDIDNYRLFGGDRLPYDTSAIPLSTDIGTKGHVWVTAHPEGKQASVYSVKQHQHLHSIGAHHGSISCIRIDPKSRYAVTAGDDGKAAAWELQSAKRLFNVPQHTDSIETVAFTEDASLIATGGYDRIIQLSKPGSSVPKHVLRTHTCAVTALVFSGSSGLVSGDREGGLAVWNVGEGRLSGRLESTGGKITTLCIGEEDTMLFAGTEKGTVALYDLETRQTRDLAYLKFVHPVRAMAYSKKYQRLAVGTEDGGIHIVAVFGDTVQMKRVESTKDYETLHRLAEENAAIRFSALYRRMAEMWRTETEAIERMIAEDRVHDAEVALVHLRGIKGRGQEVEVLWQRLKTYLVFKGHVENRRYNVAYDLAAKNPTLQGGAYFEKMEEHWNRAFSKAAKLLKEKQHEAEGMEQLTPFRGVSQKTPLIKKLVEESRRYIFFKELIARQEWKKACDLAGHHPLLQRTDAYKTLLNIADKLFISAQKAYSANDFKNASVACKTLLAFPDYKEDAAALLERMKGSYK